MSERKMSIIKTLFLCVFGCICFALAAIIPVHLSLLVSLTVLVGCLFFFACFSLLFCKMFNAFVETEKHRVLFPRVQCAIGIGFVILNMVFFSNAFSLVTGIAFYSYDNVCYYSNFVIGVLLILATRAKKIFTFQLVHIILIPVLVALSLSYSERYYVNVFIYVLTFFSIFHVILSDKGLTAKLRKQLRF